MYTCICFKIALPFTGHMIGTRHDQYAVRYNIQFRPSALAARPLIIRPMGCIFMYLYVCVWFPQSKTMLTTVGIPTKAERTDSVCVCVCVYRAIGVKRIRRGTGLQLTTYNTLYRMIHETCSPLHVFFKLLIYLNYDFWNFWCITLMSKIGTSFHHFSI